MHRNIIESMYKGLLAVKVQEESIIADTGETVFKERTLLEDIPCRASFSSITGGTDGEMKVSVTQGVTLFTAPEYDIPKGSKITVKQNGRSVDYTRSGEAAVYPSHQEIPVELFEEYA